MADGERHIKQWLHNRQFLATIDPSYNDWIVTVSFYTALHAVDVLFATDKRFNITSHDARNGTLKRVKRYEKIHKHYSPLYRLSQTVRYYASPDKWVAHDQIQAQVIRSHLYPLEQSVKKLAALDTLELPLIELKTA